MTAQQMRRCIEIEKETLQLHKDLADFTLALFNLVNQEKVTKVRMRFFHPWPGQWWTGKRYSEQTLELEKKGYRGTINRAAVLNMLQHQTQQHSFEMHRCAKVLQEMEQALRTLV